MSIPRLQGGGLATSRRRATALLPILVATVCVLLWPPHRVNAVGATLTPAPQPASGHGHGPSVREAVANDPQRATRARRDTARVSDDAEPLYLQCIRSFLESIDAPSRTAGETTEPAPRGGTQRDPQIALNTEIPLLLIPTMYDVDHLRRLLCEITVPVRYLMIVGNSASPALVEILKAIKTTFQVTGHPPHSGKGGGPAPSLGERIILRHHPENTGFAGAVNLALEVAFSKPFHEVPWMWISNADVSLSNNSIRYPFLTSTCRQHGGPQRACADAARSTTIVQRTAAMAHALTARDERRIGALEAEVLAEPSAHTPAWRPLRVLRPRVGAAGVAGGRIHSAAVPAEVSASYLLPDRVRYAAPEVQMREFQQHHCFVYPDFRGMHAFVMTRLCALTVGLFDENFYPAYFEDVDYRWRAWALGYKETYVASGGLTHIGSTNRFVNSNEKYRTQLRRRGNYSSVKWGPYRKEFALDHRRPASNYAHPFNVVEMPLDAWVMDKKVPRCSRSGEGLTKVSAKRWACLYDVRVVYQAGVVPRNVTIPH